MKKKILIHAQILECYKIVCNLIYMYIQVTELNKTQKQLNSDLSKLSFSQKNKNIN